jgi:hypothetical protein
MQERYLETGGHLGEMVHGAAPCATDLDTNLNLDKHG